MVEMGEISKIKSIKVFIIVILIIITCGCLESESKDDEKPIKAKINCNNIGITNSKLEFNSSESISEKGEIYRWIWDFGDGEISEGENVKHMYIKNGTYDVRLTIEDNQGNKDITTKKIEIIHFLRIEIDIIDNEYLCNGDINLSVEIYRYAIDYIDLTNFSFQNANQVLYLTNPTGNTTILSKYYLPEDTSIYNSSNPKPRFRYIRNYNLTQFNHNFGSSNYHLNLIGEYKLLMGIQINYKGFDFEIVSNEISFSIYSNYQVPVTLFENTLVYLEDSEYYSEYNTTYKQDLIIYNLSTNQIIMKISFFDDWIIHPYGSLYGNYLAFPLYNHTIENKQIYLVNISNKTTIKLSDTSKSFPIIYENEVIWIYNSSHYMIYYINNETWFFKNITNVKNPFENFSSYIQYNQKYLVGISSPGEFDYRHDRFLHIFDLQNNKEQFITVQKTWISEFCLYGDYLSWCDDQNWNLRGPPLHPRLTKIISFFLF